MVSPLSSPTECRLQEGRDFASLVHWCVPSTYHSLIDSRPSGNIWWMNETTQREFPLPCTVSSRMSCSISIRSTLVDPQREVLGATLVCKYSLPPMAVDCPLGSAWYQEQWWPRRQHLPRQSRLQDRASIRSKKGALAQSTKKESVTHATASPWHTHSPWDLQQPRKLLFLLHQLGLGTRNPTRVLPTHLL